MIPDPRHDAITRTLEHVADASNQLRQAWQPAAAHMNAAANAISGLGAHLLEARAKDVAAWAKAGRRTYKRIH